MIIKNLNVSLVGNLNRDIMMRNNLEAYMSNIDPDTVHVSELWSTPNILPAHRLVTDSGREEVFVGQKFATKKECVFAIKHEFFS